MGSESESSIEGKLRDAVKAKGGMAFKFVSPSKRGVPDRLIVLNGKVSFLELKRKGKEPEPLQHYWIDWLNAHGISAGWADNVADALKFVEEHHEDRP